MKRSCPLRIAYSFALIAACVPGLQAQVFQVAGGSSSLFEAQGGTLSAHAESYDASLSAGVIAGRFVGGANLTREFRNSRLILGDDVIRFQLPTDVFDSSHYLIGLGGGVTTKLLGTEVFAFAGATSTDFNSPLFEGVRAENPAGILFLKRQLLERLSASSKFVVSQRTTAIQSLDWQPADKLHLAISGGAGANQPYGAASLSFARPWIDAKAAYIEAGKQFHRVAISAPLLSEPDRENILVTVRPAHFFSISTGRQNYLSPLGTTQTNVRSRVDQLSGGLQVLGTGLSASLFHSSYLQSENHATAFTADRTLTARIHTSASLLQSRPNDAPRMSAFIANISESLTPRLSVSQLVNNSRGQTTVSFGGSFLSNIASVNAEYQTYYVPERNDAPFQQALIVDLQLHLLHGVTLHGATFLAPDGHLRYTADARAIAARSGSANSADGSDTFAPNSVGSNLLRGSVVDTTGQPVSGAALSIDQATVYTNDEGIFFVRERKPHLHQIKVLPEQFLNGERYQVITAPAAVRSAADGSAPDTIIVVERIARGGH